MEDQIEFTSFKKLIIFGNEGSGKSALTKRLEKGSFTEVSPSDKGNLIFYN